MTSNRNPDLRVPRPARKIDDAVAADLARVVAASFRAADGVLRAGDRVVLTIRPFRGRRRDRVDLLVSVAPRFLAQPRDDDERRADEVAVTVLLGQVGDEDPQVRIAACDVLGQIGDARARSALAQLRDADVHADVRRAAERALHALTAPRMDRAELVNLPLVLVHRSGDVWTPHRLTTDAKGQAWADDVPPSADCSTRVPGEVAAGSATGRVRVPPVLMVGGALYASTASLAEESPLPGAESIRVATGEVTCAVRQDGSGRLVADLRSNAEEMEGGAVYVAARWADERAGEFVSLRRERGGILTGEAVLAESFDPASGCTVSFEPMAVAPRDQLGHGRRAPGGVWEGEGEWTGGREAEDREGRVLRSARPRAQGIRARVYAEAALAAAGTSAIEAVSTVPLTDRSPGGRRATIEVRPRTGGYEIRMESGHGVRLKGEALRLSTTGYRFVPVGVELAFADWVCDNLEWSET